MSEQLRSAILSGRELEKPGWIHLNFSYLLDDDKADRIIAAVDELARHPYPAADAYLADAATARIHPIPSR